MLKLSYTEVVLWFRHESEKMAAMCHLNVASVWWGESVVLCSLIPKGRQVRDYIATKGGCSSGAWAYTQSREMASDLSLTCPA